ncbi:Sir1p [Saccharomyces cerevisiae YJM1273]|nr:Sir1p [Saccharomyces cerevisiae YJM1273]AJS52111.1 Sir1p [Saccharomyces cerevisiae YJM1434]CAI4599475.1 AVI_1a_G0034090.mRNA.1.CDS.1 [Saccharomyces cerevisiae]CAI4626258.1 ANE_G0033970.mRNA.1.CDS.1 [Saccharomyces cerevisiae]CAI6781858.1 ANE_G0033970.mRNA.1.CDS.1 [Saccharomyces cerevisiae]
MLQINSRLAVIDGWLVDTVKRKPINFRSPEVRLLLPNDDDYKKLSQQNLVDWTRLKKDSNSVLVGVKSMELFKHIKLVLREFFLLEDGRIILKRIRSKLRYKVVKKLTCKCCRLYLPKWGTVYIHPMLKDKEKPLAGVCEFSLDVNPDREYPLIEINVNHQYIIIEGFLLYLNERRLYRWNDNNLRSQVGLTKWAHLRKTYNPVSLDILYSLNSNFYFVKDDLLFQLLGKRVFVKFCKVMENGKCGKAPLWYRVKRTTTAKATHIAYAISNSTAPDSFKSKNNDYRFIVREKPIVENTISNLDYSDIKKQQFTEAEVVKRKISADISQIENVHTQFNSQKEKNNIRVNKVSSEVLDQISKFPVSRVTLLLISAGQDKNYIELVEELARRLEKICIEKTTQSLEEIRDTFQANPEMQARFDKEYYQSIEEYKITLELIKEDLLITLIKQMENMWAAEKKFSTEEEYVSPRFLVADGFLIDLAEEKPINPKDPRLLTLLKDHQRAMIDQMNLVKWNDFKKYQDPIPLKAKTLFKFCKQIKKKFLRGADFKLHTLPIEANLKYEPERMTVLCSCVPILLDDQTVQYLYDDSIIPEFEATSSYATKQSKCGRKMSLQMEPDLLFQEAIRRMRHLTAYDVLRRNYIAAFEELYMGNCND